MCELWGEDERGWKIYLLSLTAKTNNKLSTKYE